MQARGHFSKRYLSKAMASITSEINKLTMRDQESDSEEDVDLDSDDLYVVFLYLNSVDDDQAHTNKMSKSCIYVMCKSQWCYFKLTQGQKPLQCLGQHGVRCVIQAH